MQVYSDSSFAILVQIPSGFIFQIFSASAFKQHRLNCRTNAVPNISIPIGANPYTVGKVQMKEYLLSSNAIWWALVR